MKISKGTIKPFISNFFNKPLLKKLFTVDSENKGIIRGTILGVSLIYMATADYQVGQKYYSEDDFVDEEVITEVMEDIKPQSTLVENNVIKKLVKQKIQNSEPLTILASYKEETLKKYLLGQLNSKETNKIKKLLNEEVKNPIYQIDDVPSDISQEFAKSSILYNLSFDKKERIFNNEEDLRKKIIYTEALLASVAQLETGGKFQFDHREFSYTKAYGRFQITATTAATIILKLYMEEGFNIQDKEKHVSSTFYSMLKTYTNEINEEYAQKYQEKWKINQENSQLNKYLSYSKRLNYAYVKALDENLAHMRDKDGNRASEIKEKLFFSKGKLSKHKQFTFSLKVLDFLKTPENQGVLSCFVLEEIYKRKQKQMKTADTEELLYATLKQYNGDKKKQMYNGKKEEIRKIYASKGINYFKKYTSDVEQIQEFLIEDQIKPVTKAEEEKEVNIKDLFASI